MKILMINPEFFVYGGAERQIVQLCNYLTDHNHQVTLLTGRLDVPEVRRDLKETRLLVAGNNLQAVTQTIMHKYDVINPHNHPAEYLTFPRNHKVVWQMNEPSNNVMRGEKLPEQELEAVKRTVTKICVIDEYNAKRCKDIYGIEPVVNYPGVRYDFFSQELPPIDRYSLKGKFVLLQAGYVTWTKNQVESVRILAEVKKQIPNAVLVLAGYDKDPYMNEVRAEIEKQGVKGDVVLTGYLGRDLDLYDLYKLASVYISPIFEQGGWANSFEAVCAGVPTIVSDRQTCSHLFKEHKLGVVMPINEIGNTIINFKSSLHDASWNREWIRDNLTWRQYGERYEQLFNEVLGE